MPLADFYECFIYDQMEPFGDARADLLAGIITANIVNASGNLKRSMTPKDFMPFLEPAAPQTPEEMHANFLSVLNAAKRKKDSS